MKFLLFVLLYFLLFCSPKVESNFGVDKYEGVYLDERTIKFSELEYERIAFNVYSPTCIPCIKEIPALNYIHSMIPDKKKSVIFMVVDPYFIVENSENKKLEEVFRQAKEIMQKEVKTRKIEFPVILMKKPFQVNPEGGLIIGTPETLLFKNRPFTLYYNFIGPISEIGEVINLEKDAKVRFFLRMIGG